MSGHQEDLAYAGNKYYKVELLETIDDGKTTDFIVIVKTLSAPNDFCISFDEKNDALDFFSFIWETIINDRFSMKDIFNAN